MISSTRRTRLSSAAGDESSRIRRISYKEESEESEESEEEQEEEEPTTEESSAPEDSSAPLTAASATPSASKRKRPDVKQEDNRRVAVKKEELENDEQNEQYSTRKAPSASAAAKMPDDVETIDQALQFLSQGNEETLLDQFIFKLHKHLRKLGLNQELLSEAAKKQLHEAGAYAIIVGSLKQHFEQEHTLQEGIHLLTLFRNCSHLNHELDAVRTVLHAGKQYPKSPDIQHKSMRFLGNLMGASNEQRGEEASQFLSNDGVHWLLEMMQEHRSNPDVQAQGCHLIKNFASTDAAHFRSLVEMEGVSAVSSALEAHTTNTLVIKIATATMRVLMESFESHEDAVVDDAPTNSMPV